MPIFNNVEDVLKYFEQQMNLMNDRLLKLEGERLAAYSINRKLMSLVVLPDEEIRDRWDAWLESDRTAIEKALEGSDHPTRVTFEAAIKAIDQFKLDIDEPTGPILSVITGGKSL